MNPIPKIKEADLCNWAWNDRKKFSPFTEGWEESNLHREYKIAYDLRPDFVQVGTFYNTPTIWVHEFKLNANIYALDQVARYTRVIGEHLAQLSCKLATLANISFVCPQICSSLIAMNFDESVHDIASVLGVSLWKMTPVNSEPHGLDSYEIEQIFNPKSLIEYPPISPDEHFLSKLYRDVYKPLKNQNCISEVSSGTKQIH